MADGQIPKDLLYGELVQGKRQTTAAIHLQAGSEGPRNGSQQMGNLDI